MYTIRSTSYDNCLLLPVVCVEPIYILATGQLNNCHVRRDQPVRPVRRKSTTMLCIERFWSALSSEKKKT